MPQQAVHGIAYVENISGGAQQLIVTAVDSGRTYGAVMFGSRGGSGGARSAQLDAHLMR